MICKKVYPFNIGRREYNKWNKSAFEARAIMDESADAIRNNLMNFISSIFEQYGGAICIGLGLQDCIIENLKTEFSNCTILGMFMPKYGFVLKPGALILSITNQNYINKLIQQWGTLDGIQIVFPIKDYKKELIELICTDKYIYNRHTYDIWNNIMKFARIIITDTSIGREYEIVYHKDELFQIDALLNEISHEK